MKAGDLISCKYKWGDEFKEAVGYIYNVEDTLYIGLSCKDGGCTNLKLEDVKDLRMIKYAKNETLDNSRTKVCKDNSQN